jgi:hypothetical protein
MQNERQIRPSEVRISSPERRKTVVIADDGGEVSLVLLDATQPSAVGARFDHAGRRWIIQGRRHHSRVLVAEPLGKMRQ